MLSSLKYQIRKLQAAYYAQKLEVPFERNWFKGKRVALIGGAKSAIEEKRGRYIDAFDVVVRINKGVAVIDRQKAFIGTKTDVLFHSFYDNPKAVGSSPITPELWKKHQVKRIIYGSHYKTERQAVYDLLLFIRKSGGNTPFTQVPVEQVVRNNKCITPYRPTTGFIALNTILAQGPKELFLTGMTFFKTPYNADYRQKTEVLKKDFTGAPNTHNPDAEYQHFKSLYTDFKEIITPDSQLQKILETH